MAVYLRLLTNAASMNNLNSSLVKAGILVYFMTTTIYAVGHSAGFVLNVILREVLSINATFTTIYIDMYKIKPYLHPLLFLSQSSFFCLSL